MGHYLAARPGEALLKHRLGADADIRSLEYTEPINLGATRVSLHPAGHVLGSAQVRVERDGEVWVVSGDYKRDPDPTCAPFEVVPCDTFITEATFALPVYRWGDPQRVAADILAWWRRAADDERACVMFVYALGKAQRVLAELARLTDRPVWVHGAIDGITRLYRDAGIDMLPTQPVAESAKARDFAGELILAPPSAAGSPWMKRFGRPVTGFCSGWMRVRGNRRRRGFDTGFVLSDHADWPSLLRTVGQTGAQRVLATHGKTASFVRYLSEQGVDAQALATAYGGEED